MISSKFYSQITVCPTCHGIGLDCKECLGQAVSVTQSDTIYIWDAPTFIDYRGRTRVLIFKMATAFLILMCIYLFIAFIRSLTHGL